MFFDHATREKNNKLLKNYEGALVDGEAKLLKAVNAAQKGLQSALQIVQPSDVLQASVQSLVAGQESASDVQAGRTHRRWCV